MSNLKRSAPRRRRASELEWGNLQNKTVIVFALGAMAVISLTSLCAMAILGREIPNALTIICSSLISGLTGMLVRTSTDRMPDADNPLPVTAPEPLATTDADEEGLDEQDGAEKPWKPRASGGRYSHAKQKREREPQVLIGGD